MLVLAVGVVHGVDEGKLDASELMRQLTHLSRATARSAGEAQQAVAVARGDPLMKAANKRFDDASRMMSVSEGDMLKAARMKQAAAKALRRAQASQRAADVETAQTDASVARARASALHDLKRAMKSERRNEGDNLRVEAMQQRLASLKYGGKALQAKVQEVKMKDKAKYMKLNAKAATLSKKVKASAAQHTKDQDALKTVKDKYNRKLGADRTIEKKEKRKAKSLAAKYAHEAVEAKKKMLGMKKNVALAAAVVKQDKKARAQALRGLKKSQRVAKRAVRHAGSPKMEQSNKGVVAAEQASAALKQQAIAHSLVRAEVTKLSADVGDLVRKRIRLRFQKLKHETAGQARAEAQKRAKKRAKKSIARAMKKVKRRTKRRARKALRKAARRAKKQYQKRKREAKKVEKANLKKNTAKNRFLKKAGQEVKKAAAGAKKQIAAAKERREKDAERKRAHTKFLNKAKVLISNEFEKLPNEALLRDLGE